MSFFSWLRNRQRSAPGERRRPQGPAHKRAAFRPRLEALEDRWLPSSTVLNVTNTLDSGHGSLRYEIAQAETSKTKDTIEFNIPKKDPGYNSSTGAWTIRLTRGELDI